MLRAPSFLSLISTFLIQNYCEIAHWLWLETNESINDEGVCRTAPATPGLSNTTI